MANVLDDLKLAYKSGNITTRLLFVNVGIFLVLTLIRIFGFFYQTNLLGSVMPWISGGSGVEHMLYRPWTLITYMFLHEGFWHLFWNMIMLYFGGRIYADMLGDRRFTLVYDRF